MTEDNQKLAEIIDGMPEDRFIEIVSQGDDKKPLKLRPGKHEELALLGADRDKFHTIGVMNQAGFARFAAQLEHHYFDPRDYNVHQQFEYRIVKWKGMIFSLLSIPVRKREYAYESAEYANVVLKEGLPFMGGELFPLKSDERVAVVTNKVVDTPEPYEIRRITNR